jgi:hypothetical protein
LGVGLAAAAAGTFFAIDAGLLSKNVNGACSPHSICPGETLQRQSDRFDRDRVVAGVLLPVAAVAVVGGAVALVIGLRPGHSRALRDGTTAMAWAF